MTTRALVHCTGPDWDRPIAVLQRTWLGVYTRVVMGEVTIASGHITKVVPHTGDGGGAWVTVEEDDSARTG
jgi:hypothetical protein